VPASVLGNSLPESSEIRQARRPRGARLRGRERRESTPDQYSNDPDHDQQLN
jgi:hypothetical protein